MSGCPARLVFPTAPYLDMQCTEPPGHFPGTLHRVKAKVPARLISLDEERRLDVGKSFMDRETSRTSAAVYMQWEQEVPDERSDA